jgi:hypothetical protein
MADQTNRGASRVIVNCAPQTGLFTAEDMLPIVRKEIPDADRRTIVSACSYLCDKGILEAGAVKGIYRRATARVNTTMPDVVVIDRLLDAMAEAEPILKRWRRVQEALDGINAK